MKRQKPLFDKHWTKNERWTQWYKRMFRKFDRKQAKKILKLEDNE